MKKGTFYSIGVGPGNPKLMTLEAVETIKACDVIALPQSGGKQNVAFEIAKDYLDGKEIVFCDMPMIRGGKELRRYHEEAAGALGRHLDGGKDVGFLTLGDPSIYSTAMYIHRILKEAGYRTGMIAGVPSFCAAAARLDIALCEGRQPLHVIPASYRDVEQALLLPGTQVLMKSGKSVGELKEFLETQDKDVSAVECCGMENEKIHYGLDTIDGDASYFSVIIAKEKTI